MKWLSLACVFLAGCGRYADFTLPQLPGGLRPVYIFAEDPSPAIPNGNFTDVLNPSVVRTAGGLVNLYSVFDGRAWHTALATSSDGSRWQPQGIVLSPQPSTWEGSYIAANGSALFEDSRYWYWYQAGPREDPRIGLAVSSDGRRWRKQPAPVIEGGPYMSWDERGVADPYVIRSEGNLYMYYTGLDRAKPSHQRIGIARSTDGIYWKKLRSGPVLDFGNEANLGEPAVWSSSGYYWMLVTVRNRDETRYLELADSTDGVHWTALRQAFRPRSAWDSEVLCDPSVLEENGRVEVWFGGGDRPSPDENLHGQIGHGRLIQKQY